MKVKDIDVMQVCEGNPISCAKRSLDQKCAKYPKIANAQISLLESKLIDKTFVLIGSAQPMATGP